MASEDVTVERFLRRAFNRVHNLRYGQMRIPLVAGFAIVLILFMLWETAPESIRKQMHSTSSSQPIKSGIIDVSMSSSQRAKPHTSNPPHQTADTDTKKDASPPSSIPAFPKFNIPFIQNNVNKMMAKRKDEDDNKKEEREENRNVPPILRTPEPRPLFQLVDPDVIKNDRQAEVKRRREAVVAELRHSYKGYEMYAFGHDELRPISRAYRNWKGELGLSVTMIDSLSTLHLAGLHDEFERAVKHIEEKLTFDVDIEVSHFETTIRLLAGLLSAYELSEEKHKGLLSKATDLADRLLKAYDTPTGIPRSVVNLRYGNSTTLPWQGYASPLAEFGTVQLELNALTYHTHDKRYARAAQKINTYVEQHCPGSGLCPTLLHPDEGGFRGDMLTIGGLGDSYYEYLLKQWVHTGRQNTPMLHRYLRAAASIHEFLVVNQSGYTYVTEKKNDFQVHRMDHLACFVSGLFVLGERNVPWSTAQYAEASVRMELPRDLRQSLLTDARGVVETCTESYRFTRTHLGPEVIAFNDEHIDDGDKNYMRVWRRHQPYILRPETLESVYYMWVHTHEHRWQDIAWEIFRAIRHHCRVAHGYSGIMDVMDVPAEHDDVMQSFWIAETLKYLYLIFSDDVAEQEAFLSKWVFNTEAHPLRIREDFYDKFPMEF